MAGLTIHSEKLTPALAKELSALCPFGALEETAEGLAVGAGCKMCRLCVKKSSGVITEEETPKPQINKEEWVGVAVFADFAHGRLHPVTLELLGKAQELAAVTGHPVYALLLGSDTQKAAAELLRYGADRVYVYDHPALAEFTIEPYADAFADFIENVKPSSILVGATNLGRSLAPRVAARFGTGLTADCTVLEMEQNTDLVQIRPAFGGNIMARIITPNHRPQFCTVRYKIFFHPQPMERPRGTVQPMTLPQPKKPYGIRVDKVERLPKEMDISDADTIVAVGRGVRTQADLELARQLAEALNAQLACTRPLVENGWLDAKHQIGLSGRTVKPKLLIALGISGAVQFTAGMRGADCIIAVNSDEGAPIFDAAHYGLVGDLYEMVPALLKMTKEDAAHVS